MHYLTFFALLFGLLTSPALAQDLPINSVTTEETLADGAVEVAVEVAVEGPVEAEVAAEGLVETEAVAEVVEGEDEAPEGIATDEEAVQTALSLVDALKGGQWPLAAGLFLTLLVYLVNRFALKEMVDEKYLPWIAAGVGVAGAVGVGLATGMPVLEAVTAGILAGVMAVGGWEAVAKHMFPKKTDEVAEAAAKAKAEAKAKVEAEAKAKSEA